jgi:glyoxylase-like metal-dependent hydrolase (beta-lactamase superfamily II)
MNRAILSAILLVFGGLSIAAGNYQGRGQRPSPEDIPEIRPVRGNLYVLTGSDPSDGNNTGGNTAVFVTAKGVVLVDTKNPGSGQTILRRIKAVTDKPVAMIINTHTHSDHTGSNTEFATVVDFVAHENTKGSLSKPTCAPVTNCQAFKGENAKYLPNKTFKNKLSLLDGKDRIDLYYFGRGHTNGDAWIVFPALRAMHSGDMFQRKNIPAVNPQDGGSGVAFAQTLANAVATIRNVVTIIPGHRNTLATWSDLVDFVEFYKDFLTTVQQGIKAGKSRDDVATSYRIPDKFKAKGYTSDNQELHNQRAKALVDLIYTETKK